MNTKPVTTTRKDYAVLHGLTASLAQGVSGMVSPHRTFSEIFNNPTPQELRCLCNLLVRDRKTHKT